MNAQLLELRGQTAEAAAINFDMANEKMEDLFTDNNSSEGLKALEALRESTIAQANLNKLTKDFSVITADLSLMEQRIALDRESGAIGELEALQKTGEARKEKIALLQEEINKYLQIQQLSGLNDEQRQSFERLQFQLEQLNSVIDPVASRINTVVNDAAGDLFNDLITGSKSAKEAFEDFGNSIFREMTSLISKQLGKDLMESLFGGSTGSGGIGGLFSGLFGGGGGGKSSGGGFFDFLGGLFGGFRANGGPVQAGKFYEVNENENELFTQGGRTFLMSSAGGRVDPIRGGMGGGFNQVINFNHQGRIDRRTQNQVADETRRRTNTAVARLS